MIKKFYKNGKKCKKLKKQLTQGKKSDIILLIKLSVVLHKILIGVMVMLKVKLINIINRIFYNAKAFYSLNLVRDLN